MSVGELQERSERPAYVTFERRAVEDKQETLKAGYSVSKDVDFVLVTPPYSKDVVEMKVEQWFLNTEQNVKNSRTPPEWLDKWKNAYKAFCDGQEAPLDGTPIRDWSSISPAQIKNLLAIKIFTVEDLAQCNDQGMQRIGMGAAELKQKAINWLKAAKDHGPLTLKVTQLETENSRLKVNNDDLIEKNKALMNQLDALRQPIQAVQTNEITMDDITPDPVVTEKSLSEQYIEKFGKKPHHLMKDETIRKRLEE